MPNCKAILKLAPMVGGPLLLLLAAVLPPVFGLDLAAQKMLGLTAWIVCWWVFESVPLFVTALLPALMLPMLGILTTEEATERYGANIIFLFLGGFLLAIALEKHGLHRVIAAQILKLFGQRKDRIILGVMISAAFLSLWISNTASAMIVFPMALAISDVDKDDLKFRKALLFGVAYSASIGGIGSIIGTPGNAILVGFLQSQNSAPFNFLSWMLFAGPVALVGIFITWGFLVKIYFRVSSQSLGDVAQILESQNSDKESFSSAKGKRTTWVIAILMVSGWLLASFLKAYQVTDTGVALMGGILLFAFGALSHADYKKVPWDILILFGGGLALSEGIQASGLAQWVAQAFVSVRDFPVLLTCGLVALLTILCTELISNTACASIFIPLVYGMTRDLPLSEALSILVAVTLASSLSFMLPMATPPNALLFSLSNFKVSEMVKVGFWINLIFVVIVALAAGYFLPFIIIRS